MFYCLASGPLRQATADQEQKESFKMAKSRGYAMLEPSRKTVFFCK